MEIYKLFNRDDISWGKIVSGLSDSANYMGGKKGDLDPKVHEKMSHLLDIDGDVCHHTNNTIKNFVQVLIIFGKVNGWSSY